MNISELKDRVLFALSVPTCVRCKERLVYGEKAFCHVCSAEFNENVTRNCSRCARKLSECDCTTSYLSAHFVKRVIKCYRYNNRDEITPENALIYSLKRDNRQDVLTVAADLMEKSIRNSIADPENYLFINVPRRRKAILEYGIDHSALLAEELARRFGAEYVPILKSNAKAPQKSLETLERFKNADFAIQKELDLTNKKVILVDDIITSGASVSSAAMHIRSMGCKSITAATLAIAYRDEK